MGQATPIERIWKNHDAEFCCSAAAEDDSAPLVKCRVFDMRTHPSDLAWDSASFTCGCPGLAVPCTKEDASQDLTWLREIHAEGGLCESATEAVQPVTKMFMQLDSDACSANMLHAPSVTWTQRPFPSYPDLPGAGSGPQSFSGTYLCQHKTPYVLCPGTTPNTTNAGQCSGADVLLPAGHHPYKLRVLKMHLISRQSL